MDNVKAALSNPHQLRDTLVLLTLTGAAMVLASMDQCTRGPSITAMVLTNLNLIF